MGSRNSARKVAQRFKEPSTWAGLSALALLFGAPPGAIDLIAQIGVALASALAIALPEGKGE